MLAFILLLSHFPNLLLTGSSVATSKGHVGEQKEEACYWEGVANTISVSHEKEGRYIYSSMFIKRSKVHQVKTKP